MGILLTEFWKEGKGKHPSLTNEMIQIAEESLGVKLPLLLIELLKIKNGGYTRRFAFPTNQKTSWSVDHVPLISLSGIITDDSISTVHNILETEYMTQEWGLPEKQVLLEGDGHWWITLDYRNGVNPTVRWIDVECEEDIELAESFEDFFNGLVPESEFEV
ncbi:MAG: SMI1/KNR4 family protein [Mucilaginibacter sp.]|nr:SMI1/KNR4 family protein [Mucilaginibacter sp.]